MFHPSPVRCTASSDCNGSSYTGDICSRNTTLQISGCAREMCSCLSPCQALKENVVVNYLSLAGFSANFEQLPLGIVKLLKSQMLTWLFSCWLFLASNSSCQCKYCCSTSHLGLPVTFWHRSGWHRHIDVFQKSYCCVYR